MSSKRIIASKVATQLSSFSNFFDSGLKSRNYGGSSLMPTALNS